jgi:branched-chain amino acid transport system ATP-binding protein
MADLLSVESLSVAYGPVAALRGVSMSVSSGEVVALLGANGAGKSTLLRAISGVVRPRQGSIRLAGEPIHRWPPVRVVRAGVAHSPEGRRVFPGLTVAENLRLGAAARGASAREMAIDSEKLYGLFPILRERMHQPAGTLSGGEQQMLALSRALMARPRLLLLDEPSLGVAPLIVRTIFSTLAELKREGMTMVLVEQNMQAALELADRAYVLRTGTIALQDSAAALLSAPERVAAAYLGASV